MTEKVDITLNINGRDYAVRVEPRRTLVDVIRDDCGQTGTHIGCEHGVGFGHGIERLAAGITCRTINHLWIDAGLHGFQHVTPGQIDGRGQLEIEIDRLGLIGGDDGANHQRHIAAGQIVRLERFARDAGRFAQPRLHRHDRSSPHVFENVVT